jgi:hypothetical protein
MHSSIIALAAIAMAVIVPSALAGESVPPKPRLATRAELRACMVDDAALKARKLELDAIEGSHRKALQTLMEESARLIEAQQELLLFNDDAVKDFNSRVAGHNLRVEGVNQMIEAMSPQIAEYNKNNLEYNKRCSMLLYRPEDRAAILKEQQKGTP